MEAGGYGQVCDSLYKTFVNRLPGYVNESEVLTDTEIPERAFLPPSPAAISFAR